MLFYLLMQIKNFIVKTCLFALILTNYGCASKRYAKLALKYEDAALYELAVNSYLQSLAIKSNKNDVALIGLMRSSRRYADELEQKINDAYQFQKDDIVVKTFLHLDNLSKRVEAYQIDLHISYTTQGQFEEAKTRYLRDTYAYAQSLLDKDMFADANRVFDDIILVDPYYEKSRELQLYAQCEPIYREASFQLKNQLNRRAYFTFLNLLAIDPHYKDAEDLKQDAYYRALLTIAVKPFLNEQNHPHLAQQIKSNFTQELNKKNNPLLTIVAADYLQQMQAEQRRALSNNIPFDTRQLIPVRIWFVGKIEAVQYETSKLKSVDKTAFLVQKSKEGKVSHQRVYYKEYEQTCSARISFSYEFVNALNGSVIAADKFSNQYTDIVRYAKTNYDINNLLPGIWGAGIKDSIITNYADVGKMKNMFSARQKLNTISDFESSFAVGISPAIYRKINAYDPEK